MKKTKAYKKVPSFWWDFEDDNLVIVESDDPRHPLVVGLKAGRDTFYLELSHCSS